MAPVVIDFADLRSDVDNMAGLDVTDDERDRLLNEGHAELCTRSGWLRARVNIGPTVVGSNTYTLPSTVFMPRKIAVDGRFYSPADVETMDQVNAGDLEVMAPGTWWFTFDSVGTRQIAIFPTPTTAGLSINAHAVIYPEVLDDAADVPQVPIDFRRAIVHYAAAVALGSVEDNASEEERHMTEFERQVERLARLVNEEETGEGAFTASLAGWHH